MDELEHTLKQATLDYDEIYDKCRHILGRVEKRNAPTKPRDERSTDEPDEETPIPLLHPRRALRGF